MAIDVSRMIGAVTREILFCEFKGEPARVLVASRSYDTSVADLWDALTNVERIQLWFLPITGDLQLGGRYPLDGNAGGEIMKCEAPRFLAVTWEFGGDTSWVEIELKVAAASRVELRLEHIVPIPDDDKFWTEYGPGATGVGWEQALWGLELHVDKEDAPIEPKEAEAWLSTDEGKGFIRQCSKAWGQVSIAAGADPDTALAAEQRTTAFYTGG